jgi:transglutaminase-like putative cysteine protease
MSIHIALHHVTHYRYDRLVRLGPQVVRLRPAPHSRTRILSYSLNVTPGEHFINWQQDPQSNYMARFVFPEPTREFRVEVDLIAEMAVFNPFDFFLEPHAKEIPFVYTPDERRELAPYLRCLPRSKLFNHYLSSIDRNPTPTNDFLVALNQRLSRDIRYVIRMEPGVQTPTQTLQLGSGSCRDTAWLLVQLLRRMGLAARFVSGYLTGRRRQIPGWPFRYGQGFHRPARLVRGLSAWCGLGRPRSHLRPVCRRRPHSAGLQPRSFIRSTHQRCGG